MTAKVLVLTSKTGGGHLSLAEALRDRLQDSFTVTIGDPQPSFVHLHYRLISRHALLVWNAQFHAINTSSRAKRALRLYGRFMQKRMAALLAQTQPDLVISTYALFSIAVHRACRQIGRQIPLAILFADPRHLHQAWLAVPEVDAAFAPTRDTYQEALEAGFASDRLHLTGWPVRGQFYRDELPDRAAFLSRLGLDPACFTVFLQGGGDGAARFGQTVEAVLAANGAGRTPRLQIILAAGHNEMLYQRFVRRRHVHALPFTSTIAPYMAAADLIMGKAGPNMLFESVTLGKPFVATTYIPGQETPNLAYIREHGLGWVALDPAAQQRLIHELLVDPERLATVTNTVARYASWNLESTAAIPNIVHQIVAQSTRS
jgi:UDP-N-acetylglucosamine:LPS N-acetylglucosamine transferase